MAKKKQTETAAVTETVAIENLAEVTVTKRKPGRPVVADSARQMRLAAQAAKGGDVRRGRPANPTSARQQRMADRAAKMEAGVEIKRGRPKMVKAEAVENVES